MQRVQVEPIPGLDELASEHGYTLSDNGGVDGWTADAFYKFTLEEIEDVLESTANTICELSYTLLDRALADDTVFRRLRIPEAYWDYVADSWRHQEKDLYGRMDLQYDGKGPPKLYEFNADTPTTLYDSAVFQWEWLQAGIAGGLIPAGADQFAELHDDLVGAFGSMGIEGVLHFACLIDQQDDRETAAYLEECAQEAGLSTTFIAMRDVGVDAVGRFTDLDDRVIETMFKLYPWEWIMEEPFGAYLVRSGVHFLEPPWKLVLANKGLLPLLWEMHEGHPNLLPAYFEGELSDGPEMNDYVRKPLYSRRGANVEITLNRQLVHSSAGQYGAEGFVVQELCPLPEIDGRFPVMGCWVVAGEAAGLGIREDTQLVTGENARFVPHVILD